MKIRVIEGRLAEAPTADATGVDRRAFGEFIGPRGELASYAFGWVTGDDQDHASMTIGIGAGNPGGGTFHSLVVHQDDAIGFAHADEPFEEVPQGGPHLTAAQAEAHEDLPFVWFVVNHVLSYDRRAWWMTHWLTGTICTQTTDTAERGAPVLGVRLDTDEKTWHLTGATAGAETVTRHLHHALDEDPTLIDVLDLEPGRMAVRRSPTGRWKRRRVR